MAESTVLDERDSLESPGQSTQQSKPPRRPVFKKAYEASTTLFFNELFSIPLSRILAAIKVHPNVVTVLSLLAGIATFFFFSTGYWITAVILFELSLLADNIDGKIARLRGLTSDFGAKLDSLSELPRKPLSFLGVTIYFYLHDMQTLAILTCAAIPVHYGVHKLYSLFKISNYDLEFPTFHRSFVRRIAPRCLNLYNWFDEEVYQFEVFPLVAGLVGLPHGAVWFLYGSAVAAFLGLAKMLVSLYHKHNGRYDQIYQDWEGTKGMLDKAPAARSAS